MDHPQGVAAETLVLGGGCFWCTESVFKEVRGVLDVESGYANGQIDHPTYEQVCSGRTGHAEVVKLVYDPAQVSTRDLLEVFFATHDPTQLNRQGHDVGTQYRSGIYVSTPEQASVARELVDELQRDAVYDQDIVTEITPLAAYWPAEDYHQDFYERNPTQGYCMAVAAPKLRKFRDKFKALQREGVPPHRV
ncbi:peptide-methionine (S)-S-oxide reductase [Comamonas serinivorans]|uniref:Peptide methionine sulfoxide reductase MsrA n=1 Tax=Comamonas serinivorans TaxID=1082851 RepID=A0A1Y0EPA4_9BURK|nr:peptide-methionine (S)-S-oxide reductase MsrA [Comamonas serinivorans]ARU05406.1 peptide-methionine (S)-S-oxide reductase [Comamonas serinivorans]